MAAGGRAGRWRGGFAQGRAEPGGPVIVTDRGRPSHVLLTYDVVTYDVVARRAALLHAPHPAPYRDAFIGATALVHRMTVVTRNVPDFERFDGLTVLDPWVGSTAS